jgi:hypothetical protein
MKINSQIDVSHSESMLITSKLALCSGHCNPSVKQPKILLHNEHSCTRKNDYEQPPLHGEP